MRWACFSSLLPQVAHLTGDKGRVSIFKCNKRNISAKILFFYIRIYVISCSCDMNCICSTDLTHHNIQ